MATYDARRGYDATVRLGAYASLGVGVGNAR